MNKIVVARLLAVLISVSVHLPEAQQPTKFPRMRRGFLAGTKGLSVG
jgi:hypothetical protein